MFVNKDEFFSFIVPVYNVQFVLYEKKLALWNMLQFVLKGQIIKRNEIINSLFG